MAEKIYDILGRFKKLTKNGVKVSKLANQRIYLIYISDINKNVIIEHFNKMCISLGKPYIQEIIVAHRKIDDKIMETHVFIDFMQMCKQTLNILEIQYNKKKYKPYDILVPLLPKIKSVYKYLMSIDEENNYLIDKCRSVFEETQNKYGDNPEEYYKSCNTYGEIIMGEKIFSKKEQYIAPLDIDLRPLQKQLLALEDITLEEEKAAHYVIGLGGKEGKNTFADYVTRLPKGKREKYAYLEPCSLKNMSLILYNKIKERKWTGHTVIINMDRNAEYTDELMSFIEKLKDGKLLCGKYMSDCIDINPGSNVKPIVIIFSNTFPLFGLSDHKYYIWTIDENYSLVFLNQEIEDKIHYIQYEKGDGFLAKYSKNMEEFFRNKLLIYNGLETHKSLISKLASENKIKLPEIGNMAEIFKKPLPVKQYNYIKKPLPIKKITKSSKKPLPTLPSKNLDSSLGDSEWENLIKNDPLLMNYLK